MHLLKRIDPFAQIAFLVPLTVYLLTLAPSVTFFDSGEFITAISCLGSSHSPGYPLFINYGKPFTWLPFASVAFRVNFATAVSGALACYGAYLLTTYLLQKNESAGASMQLDRWAGVVAAVTFAFSPRLWLQSNHDKPYPLVAFMIAVILYLIFQWRDSFRDGNEKPYFIFISSFICGLATGVHQTIILMIPAFAFLILSMHWKIIFRLRDVLIAFIFGLIGFAVNLHLPIRATKLPLLNWGNPQTLEQFLWHFLRKGYPSDKVERGWSLLWAQINAFNIPFEFTNAGLFLLLIGLFSLAYRRREEVLSYVIALSCFLLVIVGHFNAPLELIFLTEEFFTPLYLFSSVFVGAGLFFLCSRLCSMVRRCAINEMLQRAVLMLVLLALPVTVCALNYVKNDQHNNYVAYEYASNVLRSVPQGGVLYTWGDSGAFPLWYVQGIERMREDLDVVHTPHLVFDWYLDGFPRLFTDSLLRRIPLDAQSPETVLLLAAAEQYNSRPVLIDYSTRYSVPFGGYKFMQKGITFQLYNSGSSVEMLPDMTIWDLYATRGILDNDMFFRDLDTGKAILIYANCRIEAAEALISGNRLSDGLASLRIAAKISPEVSFDVERTLVRYGVK